MKMLFAARIAVAPGGCGAVKKQAVETAQQTKEMTQKKPDAATQAIRRGAEQAGNVDRQKVMTRRDCDGRSTLSVTPMQALILIKCQ